MISSKWDRSKTRHQNRQEQVMGWGGRRTDAQDSKRMGRENSARVKGEIGRADNGESLLSRMERKKTRSETNTREPVQDPVRAREKLVKGCALWAIPHVFNATEAHYASSTVQQCIGVICIGCRISQVIQGNI